MAKFRFELEALLRQRQREERHEQAALAELNMQASELRTAIESAQRTVAGFKDDWRRAAAPGRVDLASVGKQATAVLAQQVNAQQAAMRLNKLGPAIEEAQRKVARAAQRRRAVELLRERRLREHMRLEAKREVSEQDDLSTSRFMRS